MATVLITGSARGIGHRLVKRCLAHGDTVFAAVRKAADEQCFEASERLHVVVMDVSDTDAVAQGFAAVDRLLDGRPLDAVVNCAAISIPGALELAPMQQLEDTLNTNALGSARMLKQALPRLCGHGGRAILVTSLWGRTSGALLGAYCASKHATESLADTARRETRGMDVHVVLVEPGVVKTQMYESQVPECEALIAAMPEAQRARYENLYRRYAKVVAQGGRGAISADRCAAGIEKALRARRPRPRYRVGMDSKIVCFLAWLLPDRWMDALMGVALNHRPVRSA